MDSVVNFSYKLKVEISSSIELLDLSSCISNFFSFISDHFSPSKSDGYVYKDSAHSLFSSYHSLKQFSSKYSSNPFLDKDGSIMVRLVN